MDFQLAAGRRNPPGRSAEALLLVPKETTRDPFRRAALHKAISLRMSLIEVLERADLRKAAQKLANCGRRCIPVVLHRRIWRVYLGCGAAYCPVCALRKGGRIFNPMRARLLRTLHPSGAAAHLVLALPHGSGSVLDRLTLLADEVRSAKHTPSWEKRFKHTVGVVMGLEVAGGGDLRGHPHAHLFVYSARAGEIQAFVAWLKARWCRRVQGVLVEGCEELHLSMDPNDWAPRLSYVLKGSELNPTWPPDLLQEVVASLSAGKQLITTWGIAGRPGGWARAKRTTNIQAFRPTPRNKLRATG
jgi:hypothetical protein